MAEQNTIMRPDAETRRKWREDYENAPRANTRGTHTIGPPPQGYDWLNFPGGRGPALSPTNSTANVNGLLNQLANREAAMMGPPPGGYQQTKLKSDGQWANYVAMIPAVYQAAQAGNREAAMMGPPAGGYTGLPTPWMTGGKYNRDQASKWFDDNPDIFAKLIGGDPNSPQNQFGGSLLSSFGPDRAREYLLDNPEFIANYYYRNFLRVPNLSSLPNQSVQANATTRRGPNNELEGWNPTTGKWETLSGIYSPGKQVGGTPTNPYAGTQTGQPPSVLGDLARKNAMRRQVLARLMGRPTGANALMDLLGQQQPY